jgi:hypothetical protein
MPEVSEEGAEGLYKRSSARGFRVHLHAPHDIAVEDCGLILVCTCIHQHTSASAYVSIRQHTSASVSIRQHIAVEGCGWILVCTEYRGLEQVLA